MTVATMDDDVFREFRKVGFSEEIAAKVAVVIRRDRRDDEFVTKSEREAEHATRENFATKVDVANLRAEIPDREVFAAKGDVAVLQNKVKTVEDAIISIDRRFDRLDERLDRIDASVVEIKESAARTDEKINSLLSQNKTYVVPFLFLTFTALIALLSKGTLWGVAP